MKKYLIIAEGLERAAVYTDDESTIRDYATELLAQVNTDPSFVLDPQGGHRPVENKPATVGIYKLQMTAVTQGTVFTSADEKSQKARNTKGGWKAKKWTPQDIALLKELHTNDNGYEIIAKALDRTPKAIAQRLLILRKAGEIE
jgi:hypothetical protein